MKAIKRNQSEREFGNQKLTAKHEAVLNTHGIKGIESNQKLPRFLLDRLDQSSNEKSTNADPIKLTFQ